MIHTPRENRPRQRRARGPSQSAKGSRESIKSTQDPQRRSRVGQQNGRAGEADDDHEALDEHDEQEHGVSPRVVLDEDGEGGDEVDYGEDEHCLFLTGWLVSHWSVYLGRRRIDVGRNNVLAAL